VGTALMPVGAYASRLGESTRPSLTEPARTRVMPARRTSEGKTMSEARPSEPHEDRTWVEGDRHEYEPPALVALGSLEELTRTPTVKPAGTSDMTTMSFTSDRALKEHVEPADGEAVLAALTELPISRWSYWGDATAAPHIGPMAQDFKAAFGVGS